MRGSESRAPRGLPGSPWKQAEAQPGVWPGSSGGDRGWQRGGHQESRASSEGRSAFGLCPPSLGTLG